MEDNQQGGAQTEEPVATSEQPETKAEKLIKMEDHERALKDLHKYKSLAKDLDAKVNDFEARFSAIENDKLSAEGRKDELIEKYKKQLAEKDGKIQSISDSFFTTKKHDAVLAECKKLGLSDEGDLSLLSFDGVEVEKTDQGRVIVHGAEEFAQELKKNKSHWFTSQSAPKVNTGGARKDPVPTELTAAYMYKLERQDKAKFLELMPKYMEQLKA